MKTLTKLFIFLFLAAEVSSLWALRVSPTYQVFRLKPGTKLVGQLTITNSEEGEITVTPSINNFYTLPENSKIKTRDWLKIDGKPFQLKSGESREVSFTVDMPKKVKGELAGNLHFDTKGKTSGMITLALSLAIYAAAEGTERPELKIPALSVVLSSHTEIGIMALNTGNVHLRPRGIIQIFDSEDTLLMNAEIPVGQPALPNKPRAYTAKVKDYRLPEGKYRAEIGLEDVDWGIQLPMQRKKFSINKDGKIEE